MKLSIVASALLIGFSVFTSTAMAANDTGRITFRGEIVNGDAPCLIGHAEHDQSVALSSAKATAFSLQVQRCARETLTSITASFAATVNIKNSDGKTMNTTPRSMLLSHNNTLDFIASVAHDSSISQLTLAYE